MWPYGLYLTDSLSTRPCKRILWHLCGNEWNEAYLYLIGLLDDQGQYRRDWTNQGAGSIVILRCKYRLLNAII